MTDLYALILALLINSTFILLVISRNFRNFQNVLYAVMIFLLNVWITINYFTNHTSTHRSQLVTNRLSFASALVLVATVWVFSVYFPRKIHEHRVQRIVTFTLLIPSFIIMAFTPYMVSNVTYSSERQVTDVQTGGLYGLYVFTLVVLLLFLARNFYAVYRSKTTDTLSKQQIRYTAAGILLTCVWSLATTTIIPEIVGDWTISKLGLVGSLFLSTFVGIAIVRHKLFDIRAFVARAIVYLLSIATVGFIYTAVIYAVGTIFIDVSNITLLQKGFFSVLALLVAVTYSPIIKFFNKYTGKIFFRDAYDTQAVLDEVGKIIVGNIDLHKIEKSSLSVLAGALKTTYLGFVLKTENGMLPQDFVGDTPKLNEEALSKSLTDTGRNEVVYDEIEQATSEKAQLLRKNDISLVIPLITKNETVGYIISGPKKSGNIFNQQDRSMLNIAANELAVALQNAQRFEEIKAFNITLQEKVDEATKELKKTNKKLLELDEAKDEFISMASHQLRTPLTSIKGYLSMLMDGDLGKISKQQDQALKEAFTSSQRMVFLISDFLNVSRIKTGKFVIEPKEIHLPDMIQEELVQLREMAEAKQLKMTFESPAEFPAVKLDENKMHQVMMNMMDNAIYYTPISGTITVQLFVDGKDVVFKVIDTGIGVPKAEQHKLFTKFFRAGNARKTRPDGTGLGLFMAQKVVVAQGGSIIFESVEGKGSTFGFRFSLKDIKA